MTKEDVLNGETITLQQFIEENRRELDGQIDTLCPNIGEIDDEMRRLWILNCEELYLWAASSGVNI